jgi:hypothetical protein
MATNNCENCKNTSCPKAKEIAISKIERDFELTWLPVSKLPLPTSAKQLG